MRKVELKGDDNELPRFTIIELHGRDGGNTDPVPAQEENPTSDE
jgi:hypothetical protein